jgi:hypothetical protein
MIERARSKQLCRRAAQRLITQAGYLANRGTDTRAVHPIEWEVL